MDGIVRCEWWVGIRENQEDLMQLLNLELLPTPTVPQKGLIHQVTTLI